MKIVITLISLPFVLAAFRNLEIQHIINCPGKNDLPLNFHVKVNNTVLVPNRIIFSGYLESMEKINGPLDLSFEINRCDLKSENCERFTGIKVKF